MKFYMTPGSCSTGIHIYWRILQRPAVRRVLMEEGYRV
jgi:hypothetical protein